MKKSAWLLLLACTGIAVSCQRTENVDPLPTELSDYFSRFEFEASQRGHNIDLSDHQVAGVIADIERAHVQGKCNYASVGLSTVTIDQDFWEDASDLEREFVVFHELGHCALRRDHLNESHANGDCLSIMAQDNLICNKSYSTSTRSDYLDELFSTVR